MNDEVATRSEDTDESGLGPYGGGVGKILHQIVNKISDPGLLGILFVCILCFGAFHFGTSSAAVVAVGTFAFLSILALRLVPLFLRHRTKLREMDIISAEKQKQLESKYQRRRQRRRNAG
jgi:hypothetical protein